MVLIHRRMTRPRRRRIRNEPASAVRHASECGARVVAFRSAKGVQSRSESDNAVSRDGHKQACAAHKASSTQVDGSVRSAETCQSRDSSCIARQPAAVRLACRPSVVADQQRSVTDGLGAALRPRQRTADRAWCKPTSDETKTCSHAARTGMPCDDAVQPAVEIRRNSEPKAAAAELRCSTAATSS